MNQSKYIKNNTAKNAQLGFTLLELLMVIAVIGILATIAVPRLQNYSQKAKFTEVINATSAYKLAVEKCIIDKGTATGCSAGSNDIPAAMSAVGKVKSVSVADGVITATGDDNTFSVTAKDNNGNANSSGATYIMTPDFSSGVSVIWSVGGSCATATPALCEGTPVRQAAAQ